MGRPVDHERRAKLLESAVDYVIEHGLSELSLRPLARELGVTTTTLVHHFGSRDQLLGAIINQVRGRLLQAVDVGDSADVDLHTLVTRAWTWMSSPQHDRLYRLLFEIYGNALQHPEPYQAFLTHVVDDWLRVLIDRFQADGADHENATAKATLVIATCRGLLLDLLTTGDTQRVTDTFNAFAAWLAGSHKVNW